MRGSDAFEILGAVDSPGPFLFTCEHASNRIPPPLTASPADAEVLGDHWGWDIGARALTAGLVKRLGGQAVASRFSRLVVDPNRPPSAATFVIEKVGDHLVELNRHVDAAEVERRKTSYFDAYHGAVDQIGRQRAALSRPFHLVSIHSFTPIYLGSPRAVEVGVLFDEYHQEAFLLESALAEEGFASALNQPYSGSGPGALIYAAQRHGTALGVKYLELEVRQDLIDDDDKAEEVSARIARALRVFAPEWSP